MLKNEIHYIHLFFCVISFFLDVEVEKKKRQHILLYLFYTIISIHLDNIDILGSIHLN